MCFDIDSFHCFLSSCILCRLFGHLLPHPLLASTTAENQTGPSQLCPRLLTSRNSLAQPNLSLQILEQCQTALRRSQYTAHLQRTSAGSPGLLHNALLATFRSVGPDQWTSSRNVVNVAPPRALLCQLPCTSLRCPDHFLVIMR